MSELGNFINQFLAFTPGLFLQHSFVKRRILRMISNKYQGYKKMSTALIGILLLFSLLTATLSGQAAPATTDEVITMEVKDKPFSKIIDDIVNITKQNVIYGPKVKEVKVTIRLVKVHWHKALKVIADHYGCELQKLATGAIKITRMQMISLEVKNKPFSEIIDGIANQTKQNIIYEPAVKNVKVTVRLMNVPWKQALRSIAEQQGYSLNTIESGSSKSVYVVKSSSRLISWYLVDAENKKPVTAHKIIVNGKPHKYSETYPVGSEIDFTIEAKGYKTVSKKAKIADGKGPFVIAVSFEK